MKTKRTLFIFMSFCLSSIYAQIIPDGIYQIYSEVNNEALASPTDVNQDDSIDAQINNLFATASNPNDDYQLFEFSHQGSDVYRIRNLGTNLYVGLKDNFCGDFGEVIARFNETDSESQIVVSINSSGHYLFQKNDTGSCSYFDLAGGVNGAKIRTFNATGANQQFRLINNSPVINDGIYQIFSEVNNEALESPSDVTQDDSVDGQINNLFATTSNASDSYQQFEFTYKYTNSFGDIYTIRNLGTGLYVGLNGNHCGNDGEVVARFLENDTQAQIVITTNISGHYLFQKNDTVSCSYFDLSGGSIGAKIRTFNDTGANQQFRLINLYPAVGNGIYRIFSEVHNEFLESPTDVNQDDLGDSTINNLFAAASDPANNYQQFEFTYKYTNKNGDIYNIRNLGTNLFVGLKDDWCGDNGEVIARFNETDSESQIAMSVNSSGHYLFQKNDNGSCSYFDLAGGISGARIRTFNATGANQQFRLLNTVPAVGNGIYRILSEVHNEFLESPTDVNQDDSGNSSINNLFASVLDFSDMYQQFEFAYQYTNANGDIYNIRNLGTNLYVGLKDNWCGNDGEVVARFNSSDSQAYIALNQNSTGHYLFQKNDTNRCSYFDLIDGLSNAKIRTFNDTGANQQYRLISDATFIYDNGWLPSSPTGNGGEDIFVLNGTYTTSSDVTYNSMLVSSVAGVEISSTDILTLTESLTNNGSFTFKSDIYGSAQLADATDVIIRGNVAVERFIPAKRAYRYLSSPVGKQSFADAWQQETHITGLGGAANGFDATQTNNSSLYRRDNISNTWEPINSTTLDSIVAGTPYAILIRGHRDSVDLTNNNSLSSDVTLKSNGKILTNDVTTGNQLPDLSPDSGAFSFVGNPYQSVVDYSLVDKTNLTNFLYVWDVNLDDFNGSGGYAVVDLATSIPNPSSSDASNFIAPGQAFFVRNIEDAEPINSSITFKENHKITSENEVNIFSENPIFYINSRLYKTANLQTNKPESDAIGLRFSPIYSTIANDEDALKITNPGENYAIENNGLRSIDKQNLPTSNHSIQLSITNFMATKYSLTFKIENKPENMSVFILDSYLNTTTELSSEAIYDFDIDSNIPDSTNPKRFQLIFKTNVLSTDDYTFESQYMLYPNPSNGSRIIHIQTPYYSLNNAKVQVFDVTGKSMMSQDNVFIENGVVSLSASNLPDGLYIVKLKQNQNIKTFKFLKN